MPITSMVVAGAMTILAIGQGVHALGRETSAPQRNAGDHVSRPYQKIFTAPKPQEPAQVQAAPEIPIPVPSDQPRVVCGMVVVPVTPALDPKMVAQVPKRDPKVEYKIRVIEPGMCKE